jgi:hypothetical protein
VADDDLAQQLSVIIACLIANGTPPPGSISASSVAVRPMTTASSISGWTLSLMAG